MFFNRQISEKEIYREYTVVQKCFCEAETYIDKVITTIIVAKTYKSWFGKYFTVYDIKQFIPYIKSPCMVGEINTNRRLKRAAKEQRINVESILSNLEHKKK